MNGKHYKILMLMLIVSIENNQIWNRKYNPKKQRQNL